MFVPEKSLSFDRRFPVIVTAPRCIPTYSNRMKGLPVDHLLCALTLFTRIAWAGQIQFSFVYVRAELCAQLPGWKVCLLRWRGTCLCDEGAGTHLAVIPPLPGGSEDLVFLASARISMLRHCTEGRSFMPGAMRACAMHHASCCYFI